MSAIVAVAPLARWRVLRVAIPPLLLGLLLLGVIFLPEAVAAVSVWSASTAYNHCFLVLPIAAFLAYERLYRLPPLEVRPLPWAGLLGVPLGVAWLVSERLGIMEGRQFAALGCVEVLVLSVLGWRMFRAMAAPLLYLGFLVPFGAFLTGPLQDFTARFTVDGLDLLGVPNFSDGHTIEIPEGVFFVAEACAGLRFLIAAVAFGALYALTLYRSPGRRAVFVVACVVVPVLANGVRALGIVAAGHWVGSAQAAAADHLVYGWLFFSAVIVLLIAAGLPFREDGEREAVATERPRHPFLARLAVSAIVLPVIAALSPLIAANLDHAAAAHPVQAPASLAGCIPGDQGVDAPSQELLARSGAAARAFVCSDGSLHAIAVAFPPRTNPISILAAQRSLTGQTVAEDVEITPLRDVAARGWQIVATMKPERVSATALWIDGRTAPGGMRTRILQAQNSILSDAHAVALLVVNARGEPSNPVTLAAANLAQLSTQMAAFSAGSR